MNFRPQSFPNAEKQGHKHVYLQKHMWSVRNNLICRGFVFKQFTFKQIDSSTTVKPSYEELQNF